MKTIGIFWVFERKIFGERTPITEASQAVEGLLDSDATHVVSWGEHCQFREYIPELTEYEYQQIPRGRVLYNRDKERFLVYLDKRLKNKQCQSIIADYFGFTPQNADWKLDCHYTTDATELDRLFDD